MRKRRFYITEEEAQQIESALRFFILKNGDLTKNTDSITIDTITKMEHIYRKLINYIWEVE